MDRRQNFTSGKIFPQLVGFMLPILGALILQAMYGAVDLLIVGRFGTTAGISGVATGSSIMNLITFPLCALATGVTVLISRYIGEERTEKISPLLGGSIAFFCLLALAVTIFMPLFAKQLAIIMQAPAEAVDLTAQYIRICGGGYVFVMLYNFFACIFRGLGDSKTPLLFVAIACVVNIAGDLLLVAVLHMNVAGAAIATIVAQAVSVILSLIIIRRRNKDLSIGLKDIRFGREVKEFLKIGTPLALQSFLTDLTFLALCAFINRLGLDASSGYGIAQKIQSFIMLIPSSLMQCMAPFVSQNVGAGKEDRATRGMLCGMAIGCSIGVFIAVLVFFKGDMVSSVFSSDAKVVARSFEFLRGFAIEAVVTSILFSFLGYFNGHSKSLFVMLQGLVQSFLIRLPMSYFMSIRPNASLTGIGLAAPTATVFGILFCTLYFRHLNHRRKAEIA